MDPWAPVDQETFQTDGAMDGVLWPLVVVSIRVLRPPAAE